MSTISTPNHRRRTSNLSINSNTSSHRHSYSRPTSASPYSPALSRTGSLHEGGGTLADEFAELNDGEALDTLDDELGDWGDEEEMEDLDAPDSEDERQHGHPDGEAERDSGIDVASSPPAQKTKDAPSTPTKSKSLQPPSPTRSQYDGSEYGSESDLEETELVSASLEARMASIEAMARRGLEENGSAGDRAIVKFTERLKDLGAQSTIETGASRLTTAHSALTTHLTHQSRLFQRLTSSLLSPLTPMPHPDLIDDLLPDLDSTVSLLAHIVPSTQPVYGLHSLVSYTSDLTQSLSYLTDTLHVTRQSTNTAGRRLRAVREVLSDWRRDWNLRESGIKEIERGGWEQKLSQRKCAAECQSILSGFDQACDVWRDRLIRSEAGLV